jgi:hypothetical protein
MTPSVLCMNLTRVALGSAAIRRFQKKDARQDGCHHQRGGNRRHDPEVSLDLAEQYRQRREPACGLVDFVSPSRI